MSNNEKIKLTTEERIKEVELHVNALLRAGSELRQAQRDYMANRGNQALGKIVAMKARELDNVMAIIEQRRSQYD